METRINQYELTSPKLSKKEDLLVISDIHSNIKALQLVKKILTNEVKYIMIPGDTLDQIDSPEKEKIFEELKLLSNYVQVAISLGNHDTVQFEGSGFGKKEIATSDKSFYERLEKETDCIVLTDDVCGKKINNKISVSAINMPVDWYQNGESKEEFDKVISDTSYSMDSDKFNIMLSHTPNPIITNNKLDNSKSLINNSNLIVSGHNHGGLTPMFIQKRSKSNKGLVGPYARVGQPNAYGYWTTEDTSLILSNGITKIATSNEISALSSIINKVFIPDVELVHIKPGKEHSLKLIDRKVRNVK